MHLCLKLISFYLLIFTCLYIVYQLFTFEITESTNKNNKNNNKINNFKNETYNLFNSVNIFKFRIVFGIIFLIFLNYNLYFNQKKK